MPYNSEAISLNNGVDHCVCGSFNLKCTDSRSRKDGRHRSHKCQDCGVINHTIEIPRSDTRAAKEYNARILNEIQDALQKKIHDLLVKECPQE